MNIFARLKLQTKLMPTIKFAENKYFDKFMAVINFRTKVIYLFITTNFFKHDKEIK